MKRIRRPRYDNNVQFWSSSSGKGFFIMGLCYNSCLIAVKIAYCFILLVFCESFLKQVQPLLIALMTSSTFSTHSLRIPRFINIKWYLMAGIDPSFRPTQNHHR
jgi:hypothetical protein